MLLDAPYTCPWCGACVSAEVDPSAGRRQRYVEDCAVCCRPNLLDVEVDADWSGARVEASRESG